MLSLRSVGWLAGWCGLVLCLAATSLVAAPPVSAVAGYGDVAEGRYYTEPVQWSVDNNITGIDGNCFSPDAPVSRGEAAVYIWNMEGQPDAPGHGFVDVTDESQNAAVSWMSHTGITTGTSETTFGPDVLLTRAHLVTFLWRLANEPEAPVHPFVDVHAPWQQGGVSWASDAGITTGTSPTTFSPDTTLTRAHLVTFLYRYQGQPAVTVDPATPLCDPQAEAVAAAFEASHVELLSVPSEGTVVAYRGQGSVSWPAGEALAGSPVAGYEVQWKEPGQSWDAQRRAVVVGLSYAVNGLNDGVTYSLRVRPATVERAEVAGASIVSAQGTSPSAKLVVPSVPLEETRDVSAFDGAVDLEITGDPVWPVTVEIPVDLSKIEDGDFVFLVSFSEQHQSWLPDLSANFDRERGVITAEVYHLSWWDTVKATPGQIVNEANRLGNRAKRFGSELWTETKVVTGTALNRGREIANTTWDGTKLVYESSKGLVVDGAVFLYDKSRDGVVYVYDKGKQIVVYTYTKTREAALAAAQAMWEGAKFVAAIGWEEFKKILDDWIGKFVIDLPSCTLNTPEWVERIEKPTPEAPLVVCPETASGDGTDLRLKVTVNRYYPMDLTARLANGKRIAFADSDDSAAIAERISIEKTVGSSAAGTAVFSWLNSSFVRTSPVITGGTTHWLRIPEEALGDHATLRIDATLQGGAWAIDALIVAIDMLAAMAGSEVSASDVVKFLQDAHEKSQCFPTLTSGDNRDAAQQLATYLEVVSCLAPRLPGSQIFPSIAELNALLFPVLIALEVAYVSVGIGLAATDRATHGYTTRTTIHAKPGPSR
ncbi:MAG: hypothetical protein F4Z58_10180 [Acidimicrobiaceae bacterium]|nr:hypothetical protein [Acidimicrobiaceae bacterium]MYD06638.1 hypothetical protein [Acidimicrobiaceae bacterium]MYI59041.1 hypothetical protein [Acidimicrobiaceae bacterium]